MRITQAMVVETTMRNMEKNLSRTEQLQNQITSGSQLTKPSDNPVGTARALQLQEGVDQTSQFLGNIDQARSWLETADSSLDAVTSLLHRSRELAVQASNGTISAQDRVAILSEVQQLQQHALDLSHAKYGQYFLFSGTRSDQPGYVQAKSSSVLPAAYQGNRNQVMREISPGVSLSVSTDAQATFDPVFAALDTLATGLAANDDATVQGSITGVDTALNSVLTARAQIGAKTNRLDFLGQRLESVKVNMTQLLSDVKDVDMAEAITNFSMAQTTYQASLKASAQAMQPSLLDYLR